MTESVTDETIDVYDKEKSETSGEEVSNIQKQNNALLYLSLKEGYKITLPHQSTDKPYHYCGYIRGEGEDIDDEGLIELGREFSELVEMKFARTGADHTIILEPGDLFCDGGGILVESSVEKKENLPSPFD